MCSSDLIDRRVADQIVLLPNKKVMRPDMNDHVEVTGRATANTGFAVAGAAQPGTIVDAGGDADLDLGALLDATFAGAFPAGVLDDLTGAVAARASGGDLEEPPRMHRLAPPVTGGAGLRLRITGHAAPVTLGTGPGSVETDFLLDAGRGFLEVDFQIVPAPST